MPHKHTRRKTGDVSSFDLPPSAKAKPLSVRKEASADSVQSKRNKAKRKKIQDGYGEDDTPKAFARLMQFRSTGKGPKGLDNGDAPKSKKRKLDQETQNNTSENITPAIPKIMPGERMSDFAARVNQALPISGLARKGKIMDGIKERMTKHEKKLRKLQEGWRKEEARIREKEEEKRELAEEEQDELEAMWEDKTSEIPIKGRKGKRRRLIGEQADNDGDPWEALKASREQPKGLHDVVQEPPQFTRIPKEKFKVKNGARVQVSDVPNAAGSLRRREELGEARKSIIESYRKLMGEKRNSG
ncbi:hypothetical protein AOQ84DRAFT_226732 [Glonium stellatum]|uniref:Uncharacterized protein n=1 Tax=Glonium stellatum TaxID=574774 RepID=A0A8E2JNL9_9PEZI|nr:hypothetical protein AOQ84DRAFT_226732 [Glonium stellatum]